jgi:hypothetical protein
MNNNIIKGNKMIEDNKSIIEIIQKMVQEGQTNEEIIKTLEGLGVNKDQSKRLLLIAEADTFTLLKKEINALVVEELEEKRKDFEKIIQDDIKKIEEKEKIEIKKMAKAELDNSVLEMKNELRKYQYEINQNIESSNKTINLTKVTLDTLTKNTSKMELDIEQLKIHKFRKNSIVISYLFLLIGIFMLAFSLYLAFVNFNNLDMPKIILISTISIASIGAIFASVLT